MKAIGVTSEDIKDSGANAAGGYITSFILSFVLAYGLAVAVHSLDIGSFGGGLLLGFGCWLAFNFSVIGKYIFFEDRPIALVVIDGAYDILTYSVMAGILAVWR
jgi:hypothetical protein